METFVCFIMKPSWRWHGELCVCGWFLCACCFVSGFDILEMLPIIKRQRQSYYETCAGDGGFWWWTKELCNEDKKEEEVLVRAS